MRVLLPAMLGLLSACGAKPPPRVEPPPMTRRDLTVRLETDRGRVRLDVDGRERMVGPANRGSSVTVGLTEGDHLLLLRGEPSEYGGMGVVTELLSGTTPVLALSCPRRCDGARLAASEAAPASGARCAGIEVRGVSTRAEDDGGFAIRLVVHIAPAMSDGDRAALGCR
jgi:hypothetical protein